MDHLLPQWEGGERACRGMRYSSLGVGKRLRLFLLAGATLFKVAALSPTRPRVPLNSCTLIR